MPTAEPPVSTPTTVMGQLGEFLAEEMLKKQDQIDEVNAVVRAGTFHQWNNGTRGERLEIDMGDDLMSKVAVLEQHLFAGDDGYGPGSSDPSQPYAGSALARLDELEAVLFDPISNGTPLTPASGSALARLEDVESKAEQIYGANGTQQNPASGSIFARLQTLEENSGSGSGSGGGGDTTGTFDQMLAAFNAALTDGQNSFWYDDGSAYVSQSGGGSQIV